MATILLIEDSPTERRVLSDALQAMGWQVLSAANAEEGLGWITANRPDLVLLDVVLPGQNGFQFCRHLKRTEATKHLPVVLVTSKDGDADRYWGMKQGADAYLTKPVDNDQLISTIGKLLP